MIQVFHTWLGLVRLVLLCGMICGVAGIGALSVGGNSISSWSCRGRWRFREAPGDEIETIHDECFDGILGRRCQLRRPLNGENAHLVWSNIMIDFQLQSRADALRRDGLQVRIGEDAIYNWRVDLPKLRWHYSKQFELANHVPSFPVVIDQVRRGLTRHCSNLQTTEIYRSSIASSANLFLKTPKISFPSTTTRRMPMPAQARTQCNRNLQVPSAAQEMFVQLQLRPSTMPPQM
jgi:hypothetical protein